MQHLPLSWRFLGFLAALIAGCSGGDGGLDGAFADLPQPDVWKPRLDQGIWEGSAPDASSFDGAASDLRSTDGGADANIPGVLTAPFFLDFEQNDGKLVGTRDWEWGKLSFKAGTNCSSSTPDPPKSGKSGTHAWGTVLNDCHNPLDNASSSCKNADTSDDSVLTMKIKLPSHFTKAKLTYWEWNDYFLTFDWTEVRINGKVAKQSCTGSRSSPVAWTKQTIDLSAHVGMTIAVAFHFMATSTVNYSGWYLDDINVSEF